MVFPEADKTGTKQAASFLFRQVLCFLPDQHDHLNSLSFFYGKPGQMDFAIALNYVLNFNGLHCLLLPRLGLRPLSSTSLAF